jgi:actin-like ATPase involved in cell morphogenesis
MRAWLAQDSMTCVARGAGKVLESLDVLREVLVSTDDRRPRRPGF